MESTEATKGGKGTCKRKRQVKDTNTAVSEEIKKIKKIELEIEKLKKQNEELERKLALSSSINSENNSISDETDPCMRFGLNEVKTLIQEFDPSNESCPRAKSWIENIESLRSIYKWDERMTLFYASSRLSGSATTWYVSRQNKISQWDQFKVEFTKSFPSYLDTSTILYQIMTRKRNTEECIENYFYDIVSLGKKIDLPDESIKKHIISNINDNNLSTVLMSVNRNELTLSELLVHIKKCQEIIETEKQCNILCKPSTSRQCQKSFNVSQNNKSMRYIPYSANFKNSQLQKNEKRCFKCDKPGHLANNCHMKSEKRCFKCHTVGHLSRDCKTRNVRKIESKNIENESEYYKVVLLGNEPTLAFLDLGSECTTLQYSESIRRGYQIEDCNVMLYGFGGMKNKVKGKIMEILNVDEFEYETEIMIVEDSSQNVQMIIGKNFLDRPGLKVVKRWGKFELVKDNSSDELLDKTVLSIKMLEPIKIESINIKTDIPNENEQLLVEMINKYRKCFAINLKELGNTSIIEMKIILKQEQSVKYRPYKVPYALKATLDQIINELLELEVIRPSCSEYSSPVLLIKKKEGDYRMCVDYRKLNSIIKREVFPVPNIEETLNSLSNKSIFTSLDLLSGYYQINVAEESKHLTSFVTPNGQYEFNKMPFGLTNSPAVFMRMMHKILEPIKSDSIIVYMDDVLIATETLEENLETLEKFLKELGNAGLTLKLEKCLFFQNKIQFLGHEISSEGIKPGEAKTASIDNYKTPQSVKEVRQFLGLAGYFRRFVQNFAQISGPLRKLLRKGEKFEWTEETENAFKILKEKLCQKSLLTIYDVEKEHELHTDASGNGIAGILMQKEPDGSLKPVSYFSRATNSCEQKYHSYELEALAVVESLERFKFYLLNKHFKVVTDCLSLKMTQEKRDVIPRIARWWLKILEFDFELDFRPGTKLRHVDALSRAPHEPGEEAQTVAAKMLVVGVGLEDWLSTL